MLGRVFGFLALVAVVFLFNLWSGDHESAEHKEAVATVEARLPKENAGLLLSTVCDEIDKVLDGRRFTVAFNAAANRMMGAGFGLTPEDAAAVMRQWVPR